VRYNGREVNKMSVSRPSYLVCLRIIKYFTQSRVFTLWLSDTQELWVGSKNIRVTDYIHQMRLVTIIIYKCIPKNLISVFCLKQIVKYKIV
jgi:hypothetical protein